MGSQHLRVGLLVLTALVVFMATIFSLGQRDHVWERKTEYEIHFARAGGLIVGAGVSLTGVPVGSVTAMRFPTDPTVSYIEVRVKIAGDVASRVRENTVATIRTLGLLGDRYIELSAGSSDAPPLPAGGVINSIDPIDYEAVLGQSGDIVTNVVEVTASLKTVLGAIERGEGLLGAMLRNRDLGEATLRDFQATMSHVQETSNALEEILQRVRRGEGLLGRLTQNTKESEALVRGLTRTAQSLDDFTARLTQRRGIAARLVDDEAYARRVLENLDRTLAELAQVMEKLNKGEGTLGRLVNDPALYEDTQGLVGQARRSWLLRLFGGGDGETPPPPSPTPGPAP
jgi:phospholipid/cholesterol/gamma-HCH transport system substrate-binding protein